MLTTFASPTDVVSDSVNYCVRRRFVATSVFLVDGCAYNRSFCEIFSVITVNVFVSEHK